MKKKKKKKKIFTYLGLDWVASQNKSRVEFQTKDKVNCLIARILLLFFPLKKEGGVIKIIKSAPENGINQPWPKAYFSSSSCSTFFLPYFMGSRENCDTYFPFSACYLYSPHY
jgi:hypothetical protein